jgi:hypothetical protein
LARVKFFLTTYSAKEIKKKSNFELDFHVVDILKIVRDLGYSVNTLSQESEFIINFEIQKKILQGIYTDSISYILIVHKEINDNFIDNLIDFLNGIEQDITYTIELI